MGRTGNFRKPEIDNRSHYDLNRLLHKLHVHAAAPSSERMASALEAKNAPGLSKSSIYDAFTSSRLPSWPLVEELVLLLGSWAPRGGPMETDLALRMAWDLWVKAREGEEGEGLSPVGSGSAITAFPTPVSRELGEIFFLPVAEAADRLRVTEQTVYRMISENTLAAIRISERTYRIPVQALTAHGREQGTELAG